MGSKGQIQGLFEAKFEAWGPRVKLEAWRADLKSGGLILGLEGKYEVWRADLSSSRLNCGLKGLI